MPSYWKAAEAPSASGSYARRNRGETEPIAIKI
jgi:hypothetical protein